MAESSPASVVVNHLQSLITCEECHGTLEDPRTLSCRHNFCLRCLIQMFDRMATSDNILICPIEGCCTGTLVIDGIVDNLPMYTHAQKIQEILYDHQSHQLSSLEMKHTLCTNDDRKAEAYCATCGTKMCKSCRRIHDNRQGFESHLQLEPSEELLKALTCMEHAHLGRVLEAYCTKCWVPVCKNCQGDGERHDECSRSLKVVDFAKCDGDTHQLGMLLQAKSNSLKATLKEVDDYEKDFDHHISEVHRDISEHRERLLQQLEELERVEHDKLEQYHQTTKVALQDIRNSANKMFTEIQKSNKEFVNVTQPLPQVPTFTIAHADSYLDEIQSVVKQPEFFVQYPPRYKFRINNAKNADACWGTLEEDKSRPKPKNKPRRQSPRNSLENRLALLKRPEPSTNASSPKQAAGKFFGFLFGPSRNTLPLRLQMNTGGVVETICCTKEHIITFQQDPPQVRVCDINGALQSVSPELKALCNSRRATINPVTKMMAAIQPPRNQQRRSVIKLLSGDILMKEFEIPGVGAAVCFTRYDDLLVCLGDPTSKLCQFSREGQLEWEVPLQHGCQRIAIDCNDRILILSNSKVHLYDSMGQDLQMSFTVGSRKHADATAPRGLCVDARNNILVADYTQQTVSVYTPSGDHITEIVKVPGTPRDVQLFNDEYLIVGTLDRQLFVYKYQYYQ